MKWISSIIAVAVISGISFLHSIEEATYPLPKQTQTYWNNGLAEISSFELKQARYGEVHEGKAVLIFVTEPFSTETWTKADTPSDEDNQVLKLNFTKKFNTGVYPYSMMTSSFFPFEQESQHSLKISSSSQEWCGHTFMTLINDKKFKIEVDSYFQGETGSKTHDKTLLEDDFWTKIRLSPKELPLGKKQIIPSFMYLRLRHQEFTAHTALLSLQQGDNETSTYTISYPETKRELSIEFNTAFPHEILRWSETYQSGWGSTAKSLTTTAERIQTIRSDYWNKHSSKDLQLRDQLGL